MFIRLFRLLRQRSSHNQKFIALYAALTLLSLHWAAVTYLNSSLLGQFISYTEIGILYTVGSLCTIGLFLFITPLLRTTGNYRLTIILSIVEIFVLIGMALTQSIVLAVVFFIVHHAIVPLMLFNLDMFMETMIGTNEETTGSRRGLYLSIMSFAGAVGPFAAGHLIESETPLFHIAYIASALMLFPFMYFIVRYFRTYQDPVYTPLAVMPTIKRFWRLPDIRNVFAAHFLLHLFFSWMIIYSPLYLAQAGFSWTEIGLILFVGLLAYVILEYPIGILADRWIGEKEMMAFGFFVTAIATSWFSFLEHGGIVVWIVAMFMTRVGASFIEVTTESYFFKHVGSGDTDLMSLFRITRPLSYVIGALIGSVTLYFLPFNLVFVVLGALLVLGILFVMQLRDTK